MKQNRMSTKLTAVRRFSIGVLISWIVAIGICMIGAAMITAGTIGESAGGYCSMLAILIGSMLGGLFTIKREEGKALLQSLLQGGLFYISLLCVGVLLFEGALHGAGVTGMLAICGNIAALLLKGKEKRQSIRVRRRFKRNAFVQNNN